MFSKYIMAVTTRSKTAKIRKANLKKCRSGAYKKHRKSSVCRGVKRSTVCKRRKGCSYAKGKKRSFAPKRKTTLYGQDMLKIENITTFFW